MLFEVIDMQLYKYIEIHIIKSLFLGIYWVRL